MNMSQFMDKQIMDLSNSQKNNDFIDLMNPQEVDIGSGRKEEILSSYDFQPIGPIGASQQSNLDSGSAGGTRVWNSLDSKTNTSGVGIRNYSSLESMEPAKFILEKDHNANGAALLTEIDRAMRKHADNLMHALEGVSARISQLESRTRHLEHSMDDLKVSVGNNYGSTDGKLRQLENILREVQDGVQFARDKQDIVEGQLQLAMLLVAEAEKESESQSTPQLDSLRQDASASQQSHQQLPPAIAQSPSTLSPSNATPPASHMNPPTFQPVNQFPPNQIPPVPQREAYFPLGQTQEVPNQNYQPTPPVQLQSPVPAPPQQQYQPPPPPQYSQPPPPPQQRPPLPTINPLEPQPQPQPQPQPSLGHHPGEAAYAPPQNYPPNLRQPHPPHGNPASQQFYGPPPHMYEPPCSQFNSGYSTAYGFSSGANESFPYTGSSGHYGGGGAPSQYGSRSMKLPSSTQGGGSGYPPKLPTARVLPQALPTAAAVSDSGSAGSGDRVPIDEVVDRVTGMGFPRDQVRATVRKLTENGQSVDLNVVLDKLMNDGEGQPQRGWFGR